MKFLHLALCPWICSSVSWFIAYGNLDRICTLMLCETCINLNYVELVHSAFQFFYILLHFCLFILLIFESLILKFQLKILIYLFRNNWKKIIVVYSGTGASLVAQMVKNLPAMQETWVWSLSQEDLLEKGMATHSSIFAWRIPRTKELGRLQSTGLQSQTRLSNSPT